jgi:hypothetical protein
MELGEYQGLNYRMNFPQRGGMAAQQAPQQQFMQPQQMDEDLLPNADDPLAIRRELTADYINNYALLKNVVKDALAKGLDPFQPDYSQDGGGLAYQAFQDAQAGLMYSAAALKREREMENQMTPLLAKNQIRLNPAVDRNRDMWASQGMYTSTEPLPFVTEANKFSAENTYTRGDEQRNNQAYFERASREIDTMVQNGQLTPYEAQLQKAQLQKNVSQVYAPSYFDKGNGNDKKKTDYLSLHKSLNDFKEGAWQEGTYKPIILRGKNYFASDAYNGATFGESQLEKVDKQGNVTYQTAPNKVTKTLKDKQGNVFFLYENGEMEKISDVPTQDIVKRLIEGDSSYGGANAVPNYFNQLEEVGWLNERQRSIPLRTLYGENASELIKQSKPIERMRRLYDDHLTKYNKVIDGELDRFNVTIPNEGTLSFEYDDDLGFHLANYKERGYNFDNRPKNMTFENVLDMLESYDYWNKRYNVSQNPDQAKPSPTSTQPKELDEDI